MSKNSIPRIENLRVQNYRALQDLELKKITPLTVFLGPNGSGKSTIFDVFAFLSECFTVGLRKAWDRRGRFKELRTRGQEGYIIIELKYRETLASPLITYHLAINEANNRPYVAEEWLQWRRGPQGKPFRFLDFKEGEGIVISGENPQEEDERISERLDSEEFLAVSTLGQLAKHPRVSALRRFITSWYLSYLTADNTRNQPEAGAQERLSSTGDNLPNVIQYLKEDHPQRLESILQTLSRRIPRLEKVEASIMPNGQLLLQIKDAPFQSPILAKFASDGTLKMLAYLTILYDPSPPQLVGIEEPENHLHPRLLPELAEECRAATASTQLMVTTHSPFFVDGLKPEEVWVLYRDENGFTQAKRTSAMQGVEEFIQNGALLGQLWMEDYFDVGNPII
ncbi:MULTISPECIES: AAA family ATPase [unclassified Microcystis]|uniref:AAA family ATPase n=1 Tax=unclassified Microcystis TaxID=2643300 RepID=UPI0011963803|nr:MULTISPECIES: AAA family ATPase [unclassified Microcystis]MCA2928529.1 AAA family ATPase [Microcystis sp. M020S1]MCA2936093.1 AAA family ATPase [Microcystis sp. M015S1]MCA2619668.1 AAA family ATPase [Microcystis sp. M099S2]MCA2650675.1 AAA family ATPase [Microcystis sp. M065S2]MCA2682086.1 AAA family ATPase [Microcystis sp. M043S2]